MKPIPPDKEEFSGLIYSSINRKKVNRALELCEGVARRNFDLMSQHIVDGEQRKDTIRESRKKDQNMIQEMLATSENILNCSGEIDNNLPLLSNDVFSKKLKIKKKNLLI